jgi:flagellin-like protein
MRTLRNRGLTGIGALVILIAVILVATVATSLLIYFGANLQNRAIRTGREAQGGGNGVLIDSITGTDGSAGKDIEHFEMIMKLQAGSDDLRLNDTFIILNLPATSQNLNYNTSAGDTTSTAGTTADYTVQWLKQGSNYKEGYLSRGDIIKARFNHNDVTSSATTGGVAEDKEVEVKVVPRFGAVTTMKFRIPTPLRDQREPLYPKDGLL